MPHKPNNVVHFLSLPDLCRRWRMSRRTIERISPNALAFYKLKGQRRYSIRDILDYERLHIVVDTFIPNP